MDARIPHPFQFEQPRTVEGEQDAITHAETGVHVQLRYSIPMSSRVMLVLSGGPSRLNVEQELVTDVLYDEEYPFDEATFRSAPTRRSKASVTGFNAGADLQWMFGRNFGLGGMVRFIRGSVELTTDNDRRISVRAGGLQAAGEYGSDSERRSVLGSWFLVLRWFFVAVLRSRSSFSFFVRASPGFRAAGPRIIPTTRNE